MSVSVSTTVELRRDAVLTRLDRGSPTADALGERLADPDPVIRHAALLALLALRARPDRRAAIAAVIEAIEAGEA